MVYYIVIDKNNRKILTIRPRYAYYIDTIEYPTIHIPPITCI